MPKKPVKSNPEQNPFNVKDRIKQIKEVKQSKKEQMDEIDQWIGGSKKGK